jgi:hypothetical protein
VFVLVAGLVDVADTELRSTYLNCAQRRRFAQVVTMLIEADERCGETAGRYGWEQNGSRIVTSSLYGKRSFAR